MFWFWPWCPRRFWRRRFWRPYPPLGCGCLWLLLGLLFLCLAWAFFVASARTFWW